jgi:hypothetical protein
MTTPVFGELTRSASRHLRAAADRDPDPRSLPADIAQAQRTTRALRRYLDDIISASGIRPFMTAHDPGFDATLHARQALRNASASLTAARRWFPLAGFDLLAELAADGLDDPGGSYLAAAAASLTAGRDLLCTHFTTTAHGILTPTSRWSAVITSPAVTAALLEDITSQCEQLRRCTRNLAYTAATAPGTPGRVPRELDLAMYWLDVTANILGSAQHHDQVTATAHTLLYAIPARRLPDLQPFASRESPAELCQAILISAERLHITAITEPGEAAWSPALTAESWRWTATARAVTADLTEALLRALAERIPILPAETRTSRLLSVAAEAAASTCERWRHVTAAWGQMTTETKGLTAPDVADSTDIVIRLGRLTFTDPQWTPGQEHRAAVRDPAELASGLSEAAQIFTALHHAADALATLAAADCVNVRTAITARRLHLRTRLSGKTYIRRPYGPAPENDTRTLLRTYAKAAAASTELLTALDAAAIALNAPSQILAAARTATRLGQDSPPASEHYSYARFRRTTKELGPIEQQIQDLGITDPLYILRAQAIDAATRQLITEAKTDLRETRTRRQATRPRRRVSHSLVATQADLNFPQALPSPAASDEALQPQTRPTRANHTQRLRPS